MKMLRTDRAGARELVQPSRVRASPVPEPQKTRVRPPKPAKRKRRKTLMRKLMEEAFDAIEDIFD